LEVYDVGKSFAAKQKDGLASFFMFNVFRSNELSIKDFLERHYSEKITGSSTQ